MPVSSFFCGENEMAEKPERESMFEEIARNVREKQPLVHCITNYVTVNDVANILLACGGSPIMADDVQEAAEITSICDALCINIGTLNTNTIAAMKTAGIRARELGHLIVLDPVGAGASSLRTNTAIDLMESLHPDIVRGNLSEIRALARQADHTRGVDASLEDRVTRDNLEQIAAFVSEFAAQNHCVAAVTGAIDLVSDGTQCFAIENGDPFMSKVTGTGCQLSALCAAYGAANPDHLCQAAAAAVCLMGAAGQRAKKNLAPCQGNASYRTGIIDAVCLMQLEDLEREALYELF